MKKTLAVILSAIMLLCCIPFAANAVEVEGIVGAETQLEATTYTIEDGSICTIPTDVTLYVPNGAKIVVKEGGKLYVYGKLVIWSGGQLQVEGFLYGSENVVTEGTGTALAEIRFPNLDLYNLTDKVEVSYGFSTTGNIYEDLDGTVEWNSVPSTGTSAYVPLNQYVYIKAHIIEPDSKYDKYDDSLLTVNLNGVGIPYTQGTCHTLLTSGCDVTYANWVTDSTFLNTFNIYLPTGEGYTVYGREGEQSADGETVKLKYGQSFSFKVEIDPEYDMSAYEVYVYNGYGWTNLDTTEMLKDIEPAKPDEYGYYHISEIKGEHTIYVVGVVKNETLLMVGDILDMIRNVFEMISAFFEELMALFGISLGGTDATV